MFKMTNIRLALSVASGYRYIEMEKLHQKYGKIVRIGAYLYLAIGGI